MNLKKVLAGAMALATVASMSVVSFAATNEVLFNMGVYNDATKDSWTPGATVNKDFVSDITVYLDLSTLATTFSADGLADAGDLVNSDYFKIDVDKEEGSKIIKAITKTEKDYDGTGRKPVIKVEFKELMDDSDNKVQLKVTVKPKAKCVEAGMTKTWYDTNKDNEWVSTFKVFVKNDVNEGDQTYSAGTSGVVIKPLKNEENEIEWEDNNNTLARLTFDADSDVAKSYPKLSTKWSNDVYAAMFADQDAYIFDFVGNPTISATARPVLELYNPFKNDDDEITLENPVIFLVNDDATLAASTEEVELAQAILDGRLVDITDKFTAGENEDGDYVFTTKTRTLGTYIICENYPSDEAFDEAESVPETPSEDTGKYNPGTGR